MQKVLARAGLGSRRAVEAMIAAGRIKVNGRVAKLGDRIVPDKDEAEVDGSPFPIATTLVAYLLNKPPGVVVTADDPSGRPTAIELIDPPTRVWSVGRLDVESEGALILTNDGALTQLLTHPSKGVLKAYLVEVAGDLAHDALRRLRRGVELDDGVTAPAEVDVVDRGPGVTLVSIRLGEGRNRQIRRMADAVGHPVRRLVRTAIGPVTLGRLKPGAYRKLAPPEIASLYRAADEKPKGDR